MCGSTTNILYDLYEAGDVRIRIYDISGKLVKELLNKNLLPGSYHLAWNAMDSNNREVSSGIYYLKIIYGDNHQIMQMILIK